MYTETMERCDLTYGEALTIGKSNRLGISNHMLKLVILAEFCQNFSTELRKKDGKCFVMFGACELVRDIT